ncbi:MAG: DUF2147 domain-containing protein [Gammaproteobacteria bacterium]
MKKLIAASVLFVTLPLFAAAPAAAPAPTTPVGDWITYKNDDGKTKESIVHIYQDKDEQGNLVYNGSIGDSLMKEDPNAPVNCVNCPAPFTDKKIKGLQFLWGFVPDTNQANKFINGHVLDPLTGNLYSANMTLSEDGNTLVFRGYMGISLFGSNRTWTRSEEPVKATPAKTKSTTSSKNAATMKAQ